ncbi:MAG: LysE family transporter [Thermaerobacter sp.]|nr:LysE family transporter [Thermaerobacter sp.]
MTAAFVHGFLLAFVLILPLGPQNTFILTQAATQPRWRSVLPIVVTAALSDTTLIVVAIAGVSLVILAIPVLRIILSVAGVVFLLYMGYKTWTARVNAEEAEETSGWTFGRKVRYSLSVSLLNPHAIMDTVVVIGGGAALYTTAADRWSYALSVTLVSWVWFFGLSLAGRIIYRLAKGPAIQRWLNRGSAALMWAVAVRYALQVGKALMSQGA